MGSSPALGKDPSRGSFHLFRECLWWMQADFPYTRVGLSKVHRLTDPSSWTAHGEGVRKYDRLYTISTSVASGLGVGDCQLPQ